MTSKTARVNAALKGTLSAEEMKLRASGLEMLRINATNRLWLPHDVVEGLVLTEAQLVALAKAKSEKEAHGEFESEHPGYCGALCWQSEGGRACLPANLYQYLCQGCLRQAL